jgi:hypothetical protein
LFGKPGWRKKELPVVSLQTIHSRLRHELLFISKRKTGKNIGSDLVKCL